MSAPEASYISLTALLGVKGPLRLLPQGPAPKPHIVLKRDRSEIDSGTAGISTGAIRFSFLAGKKFTVNKGQQLLFAIASPADPDGKTLVNGGNTFLMEGSIIESVVESDEPPETSSEMESAGAENGTTVEDRLPPKMRKGAVRMWANASNRVDGSKIPPNDFQFLSSTPPSRVFADAEVQTETLPYSTIPREITPMPRTSSSIVQNSGESPTQLPSPVSADHTREVIPDAHVKFNIDTCDDYARSDRSRSLSPMDLSSSENSTPAVSIPIVLPQDSAAPLPLESLLSESPSLTSVTAQATNEAKVESNATSFLFSPTLRALNVPNLLASEASEDLPYADASINPHHDSNATIRQASNSGATHPSPMLVEEDVGQLLQSEKSAGKDAASYSKDVAPQHVAHVNKAEKIPPSAPRSEREASIRAEREKEAYKAAKEKNAKASHPTFVKSRNSSLEGTFESNSDSSWALSPPTPYIPTPTVGNPLGIRPSSVLHRHSKPIPKGPRALQVQPSATPGTSKKVVVDAKWSAARNTATNASSRGGVSASASSSSALSSSSSSATNLAAPLVRPVPKFDLSEVLHYSSPSPPQVKSRSPSPATLPSASISQRPYPSSTAWSSSDALSKRTPSPRIPGPSTSRQPSSWAGGTPTGGRVSYSCAGDVLGQPLSLQSAPKSAKRSFGEWVEEGQNGWDSIKLLKEESTKRIKTSASASPRSSPSWVTAGPQHLEGLITPTPGVSLGDMSGFSFGETSEPAGSNTFSFGELSEPADNYSWSHGTPIPEGSSDTAMMSTSATTSTSVTSVSHQTSTSDTKPQQAQPSGSYSARVIVPIPKVQTAVALTHPLPPKPIITGSSYRPSSQPPKRQNRHKSRTTPPPRRTTDWPSTSPSAEYHLQPAFGSVDAGVQQIQFNSEGTQVAFVCADRTVRIWDNKQPTPCEVARLPHNSQVVSACWLAGPPAVMTMCANGTLSTWTRNAGNEWKYALLLTVPEMPATDGSCCMTYAKDRIAVSMMTAVKVWLLISGKWQQQREIVRSGVTALRFVQDGNALIGGCRDSALWYCEVPNGTLRVHAFLPSPKPILSIDVHPTGSYLLVAQEGGKAHLMTMRTMDGKNNIERTYTSEKIQTMSQKGFRAIFATKGQAVLYGTLNGCALVWDRKKGSIVYGLKHPEGDTIQAAATFDGRPGMDGWIVTGTKKGRVFWWPGPVAAAPSHSTGGGETCTSF